MIIFSRKKKQNKKTTSGNFNTIPRTNEKNTALSDLDGPPVPPDFVYEPSMSPSISLEDKSSAFNIDSARASNEKFLENKQSQSNFIEEFDRMNNNIKTGDRFSLSDVSSTTKSPSVDAFLLKKQMEENKIQNKVS